MFIDWDLMVEEPRSIGFLMNRKYESNIGENVAVAIETE